MIRRNLPDDEKRRREKCEYLICRQRRRDKLPPLPDADRKAAIDAMLDELSPPTTQRNDNGVQMALFGADDASRQTRAFAAVSAAAKAPSREQRIVEFVAGRGSYGAHYEEISEQLEIPPQSVSGLLTALKASGQLIPTNRTRLTHLGKPAVVLIVPGEKNGGNNG